MRWLAIFLFSFGIIKGFALDCTSSLISVPGESEYQVEIFTEVPEEGSGQLLIFFHGAASGLGLQGLSQDWCDHWLKKGYAIAAISLPGYGKTTGVKDFCGTYTMKVMNLAVDHIKDIVGAKSFGIIGFGQGSLAGALLAAKREDVKCVVCANGGYDFTRHLYPGDPLYEILKEKDYAINFQDPDGLVARSLLYQVERIDTPFYVLHRAGHPIISVEEVSDFASAMWKAGNECLLSICQRSEDQKISYAEVLATTETWVDHQMRD